MEIVDTHCHIHEAPGGAVADDHTHVKWQKAGKTDADVMIREAAAECVSQLICVGTDADDSALAVDFVQSRPNTWASIGIHPHEAQRHVGDKAVLDTFAGLATRPKVVAVGECGLDYYYNHSPKDAQEKILRFQIELALAHDLPIIFHVRDAYEDFWPIFDSYSGVSSNIEGVIHSFSATQKELGAILKRGLYVGLNGIMTFTKDEAQLAAFRAVPLDRMLIETDAPYLTPTPYRGKICEPKHAATNLSFAAKLQGATAQQPKEFEEFAAQTTANARQLFNLS